MSRLNKYEFICNTETITNGYPTKVYTWGTTDPTVCPNNIADSIDISTIAIIESVIDSFTLVSSSATTSTTSTSYTLMNSMTNTPAAGKYLVTFNSSGMISNSSGVGNYAIYVGGVQAADSVRTFRPNSTTATQTIYIQTEIIVNGTQAVEIRYQTSAGTFTVYQRSMSLLQVV